jgi:hypothetical protein
MANGATLELLTHCQGRIRGLEVDRYSWWTHWRELADYLLPRRYKWLITPNQAARGSPINGKIVDSTATIASRVCASGMMSRVTSPMGRWFRLRIGKADSDGDSAVAEWLYLVEKLMMRVFSESNFYNSMAVFYYDLCVFGSACQLMYEDFEDVIRCFNPCAGEYYFANSDRMQVDTVYRTFVLTGMQILQKWPDCKDENILAMQSSGGAALGRELIIDHAIEPNWEPARYGTNPKWKYREVYWLRGNPQEPLSLRGFYEFPGLAARWDLVSNDAYGRSPAMDALGDIKQLQQEQVRKAQAIDKMVNPPLLADIQLQNQPASSLPGGITYVAGMQNVGMKPVYTVNPPVQEIMEDIKEVQARIKAVFFNDLFLMISGLSTVRSATEIDARREEKLITLGPVLERLENEALGPAVERVYGILSRGGLLPPPPAGLGGQNIQVQYVSMLAAALRATETAGLERLFGTAGNLAAASPDVLDNIDFDDGLAKYAAALAVPPTVIRDKKVVAQMRAQRAKMQQQQQILEATRGSAEAAKNMSQTDVGGGMNALQAMIGGGAA